MRINLKILILLLLFIIYINEIEAYNATIAYRSNISGGTDTPRIVEWNSSGLGSYGSEIILTNSSSPLRWMQLKYSPVSSKRILITLSEDGNLDAYVCKRFCNSSSSWVLSSNIGQVWSVAADQRRFDFDFESKTGDAVVVYSVFAGGDASKDLAYKILPADNDSFTASIAENRIDDPSVTTDLQYTWVEIARNPGVNSKEMIVAGFDSNGSDINAWVWNGTNFSNNNEATAGASATSQRKALSVAYSGNTSSCSNCTVGLVVGGDGTSGNVVGRVWNGSGWRTPILGDMGASNDDMQWLQLKSSPNPADGKVLLYSQESGSDTQMAIWNGANWTLGNVTDTTVDSLTSMIGDVALNSTNNGGFFMWETDGAGISLHQNYCTFPDVRNYQCTNQLKNITSNNGTLALDKLYNGTGAWLSLYTNPTQEDDVDVLGLRLNSNMDLFLFKKNTTNTSVYYNGTALTVNAGAITQKPFALDFARVEENPPNKINLSNPLDGTSNDSTSHIFRVNATDNINLSKAELWTNISGVFEKRQSVNTTGQTYNLTEFFENSITAGSYIWNVRYCDNSSNCEFYPINYTFTVVGAANTAPSNANTTITPSSPTIANNLNCSFTYLDPDNNPGTGTIIWYNNSAEHFRTNISTAGNNTIISYTLNRNTTNNFSQGQNWTCAGLTNDGTINSANWVNASVLVSNTAPVIYYVENLTTQSINENDKLNVTISFYVNDLDGAGTVGFNNSLLNLTKINEQRSPIKNYSSSTSGGCFKSGEINSTVANISCWTNIWYFDSAGQWNISVGYSDGSFTQNITWNFTLAATSAIQIFPSNITFGTGLNVGQDNVTSSNDPITINNTGNVDYANNGSIRINVTNLVGETTKAQIIPAFNFSFDVLNSTYLGGGNGECRDGNSTSPANFSGNSSFINITNSYLKRGNHSMDNGTAGIEHIFICLNDVPLGLSAQAYSTLEMGSWIIGVV